MLDEKNDVNQRHFSYLCYQTGLPHKSLLSRLVLAFLANPHDDLAGGAAIGEQLQRIRRLI
jgi:hypothetical protein